MPISLDLWDSLGGGGRDAETPFARDEDGNLIRRVQATLKDLEKKIDIVIDGILLKDMPLATYVKDAQGVVQFDLDGYPKLRKTTIYDAAMELVRRGEWTKETLDNRIPVLCHREHLNPVAVCRMCSVHVIRKKRGKGGKLEPGDKLVPACHFEIQPSMVVTTRGGTNPADDKSGRDFTAEVFQSIRVLTEYLVADHYKPDLSSRKIYNNELKAVADSLDVKEPRPGLPSRQVGNRPSRNAERHPKSRPSIPLPVLFDHRSTLHELPDSGVRPELPYSSRTVAVDHDRCIVCDRCVRSCHDVRPFKVLGHTGKGYLTRISFDLDENMNDSSCVQCGECMNSCPTGALQLNRRIVPIALREELGIREKDIDDPILVSVGRNAEELRAAESGEPLDLKNPRTPLKASMIIKSRVTGKSATGYLSAEEMQELEFEYTPKDGGKPLKFKPFRDVPLSYLRWNEGAIRYRRLAKGEEICTQDHYANTAFFIQTGEFGVWKRTEKSKGNSTDPGEQGKFTIKRAQTIIGELAPLSNQPRQATVRVVSDEAEVFEVTRNLLDVVQRAESAREILSLVYTRNALFACLEQKGTPEEPTLFEGLSGLERAQLVTLLTQGIRDESRKLPAPPKRESAEAGGQKVVYPVSDPDANLIRATMRQCRKDEKIVIEGEKAQDFYIIRYGTTKVSIRAEDREVIVGKQTENQYFGEVALMENGRRTASITALDTVELVRIPKKLFEAMIEKFPSIKEKFQQAAAFRARSGLTAKPVVNNYLSDYLNQGLYQGRNLFVLDLHACTRCDECTRACADSHGDGYSRLIREGMRFGKYLVGGSCRSCYKPYCMDGCPVDAIHRTGTQLQIKIDDHCIRCGLCERNCPYGAIQIPDKQEVAMKISIADSAINCDKCYGLVPDGADPFCVAACPHEAAFRMTGPDLYQRVTKTKI